jgi:hypothetical protein
MEKKRKSGRNLLENVPQAFHTSSLKTHPTLSLKLFESKRYSSLDIFQLGVRRSYCSISLSREHNQMELLSFSSRCSGAFTHIFLFIFPFFASN